MNVVVGREGWHDTIEDIMEDTLRIAAARNGPILSRYAKCCEKHGELGTAVLVHVGDLPPEKANEPLIGEVAGVIQNALCVLQAAHPGTEPEKLLMQLAGVIAQKNNATWRALDPDK